MKNGDIERTSATSLPRFARSDEAPKLIIGKITPPIQTPDAVSRMRLVKDIAAANKRVVLTLAPAGFGKSILMAQLHEHAISTAQPCAWLTLDQRDNDLGRFVSYLHAVASRLLPIQLLPSGVRGTGPGQYFGMRAEASALIDALACSSRPYWLFLDDVERIDSPEVLHVLQELIDNLQDGQRLIIGSRSIHHLSLRNLELSGQLMRVDSSLLRFDVDETTEFVERQEGGNLSPADARLILDRTHGWAAGLRLIALSLAGRTDSAQWLASLSGSTRSIADYLAENVLRNLPEHACRFLLYCSVLEQLNADLCNSVLDRTDSDELLLHFERSNLFLSRITPALEPNRPAYRFHSLFRDFLQQELSCFDPASIPELNRRAAQWYAAHKRFVPAVDYALASNDLPLAAEIMDSCIMGLIDVAQLETVARWADALPERIAATCPNIQRARAYAMIALHRYDAAENALEHCRAVATANGDEVPLEVAIQFSLLHEFADRHDLSTNEIERFRGKLEAQDAIDSGIAHNICAYHAIAHSQFELAHEALGKAKLGCDKPTASSWSTTYSYCFEGIIEFVHGNVRDASTRFDAARLRAKGAAIGVASTYLALTLYETDDPLSSASLLNEHLALIRDTADIDTIIIAYRTASRSAFLDGDEDRVETLLAELGDIGDSRGVTRPKASAWLEKSRYSLIRGDIEGALRYLELGTNARIWAQHRGFRLFANELEDPDIATARFHLMSGNATLALPMLQHHAEEAYRAGRLWRRTHLQNLLSQALIATGNLRDGLNQLESAAAFAFHNGLLRTLSDEPWLLPDSLTELAQRTIIIPIPFLERIRQSSADVTPKRDIPIAASPAVQNPLTTRESGLLRLVEDGRANKEIARLLGISENTVETHLKRINQKLNTHNRTQALARAREIGLLQ